MFQYACAYNLKKLKTELIIDDRTVFLINNLKRNFSLPKNLTYRKANILEIFFLLIIRFIKKILINRRIFFSFNQFIFIDETKENKFITNFYNLTKHKKFIYLLGFFQTEKYFIETKSEILRKILNNKIN